MGCFYCIRPSSKDVRDYDEDMARGSANTSGRKGGSLRGKTVEGSAHKGNVARSFTFKELATATQNFRQSNLLGEGGFGSVFKGRLDSDLASFYTLKCFSFGLILVFLEHGYLIFFYFRLLKFWFSYVRANDGAYDQIVAVKRLNLDGLQGNQEFIVEVLMLSLLHHQNLVNLIGYCTDGDQRLLVYEFMSMGSLENHLYDLEPGIKPLSWCTRLKIAAGAAQGLEYLHCKANPPVIYRDLKSSNILLDDNFKPKLSDFGLAKLGPVGDNTHVSTRVMGTYGYCAPEYAMSGKLTLKSDIYSFGVVMLELITGRKAYDNARKQGEQNLVVWSQPFLRDRRKFVQMVDPLLEGQYSVRCLQHAVAITAMCLQEQANFRPLISDIVVALEYLVSQAECSDSQKPGVPGKTHLVPPLDPNDDHKR